MDMTTQKERLRTIIEEVHRSSNAGSEPTKEMMTAYKIGTRYMIERFGVPDTARFFFEQKQRTVDEVVLGVEIVLRKLEAIANFDRYLSPTMETDSAHDVTITADASSTGVSTPLETPTQPKDEDAHRFSKAEVYDLHDRLLAHPRWNCFLDDCNFDLKSKERGPVDAKFVAFIGCLWRKNIGQNLADPGAVPVKAVSAFVQRDKSFCRTVPDSRQIMAACRLLEDVGFMKKVRPAIPGRNGNKGQCAAYLLLDPDRWTTANTPPASKPETINQSLS